jgi:hypothetical protein
MTNISQFIAVALLGVLTSAQAVDGIQGPGTQPCKKWLEARKQSASTGKKDTSEIATAAWLQGYLSGLNVAVSNFQKLQPVQLPPLESIEAAVAMRCVEVPQVNVDDAAGWYWVNLSEKAVHSPPK